MFSRFYFIALVPLLLIAASAPQGVAQKPIGKLTILNQTTLDLKSSIVTSKDDAKQEILGTTQQLFKQKTVGYDIAGAPETRLRITREEGRPSMKILIKKCIFPVEITVKTNQTQTEIELMPFVTSGKAEIMVLDSLSATKADAPALF
jgi:hypothetical protein